MVATVQCLNAGENRQHRCGGAAYMGDVPSGQRKNFNFLADLLKTQQIRAF
jgi:hypothetical protein